jgi:hypothetical protein
MMVNMGDREYLTPFEIALLVNGIRAAIAEDYFVRIQIHAKPAVCRQFSLVTRLAGRASYDVNDQPLDNMVQLVRT